MLDLYARKWQGGALQEDEFVISADEKATIQACLPDLPAAHSPAGRA